MSTSVFRHVVYHLSIPFESTIGIVVQFILRSVVFIVTNSSVLQLPFFKNHNLPSNETLILSRDKRKENTAVNNDSVWPKFKSDSGHPLEFIAPYFIPLVSGDRDESPKPWTRPRAGGQVPKTRPLYNRVNQEPTTTTTTTGKGRPS